MIKKIIFILIPLTIATLLGWHFYSDGKYETISPTRNTVIQAIYATGEVKPVYWSKISTQVPGKVERIFVKESDEVKESQPLAKLEDSVECAVASEYLAKRDYLEKEKERYKALIEHDHTSKSKYERIVSEYNVAKAQLEAQNQVVDRMIIKSPMDGIIMKRDVETGETINQSDIIFWIGKAKPLRVIAEVDEEDIALVKVRQEVLIKADAFPDQPIKGEVTEITPKGDPVDKNFRVKISLPDDSPLLVGMTVEVNIIANKFENVLTIPVSSISDNKVWVKEGNRINERIVKTGIRDESKVQILEGLSEDDVILVAPPNSNK
jgi:RND family efflux transporter MFP subunit